MRKKLQIHRHRKNEGHKRWCANYPARAKKSVEKESMKNRRATKSAQTTRHKRNAHQKKLHADNPVRTKENYVRFRRKRLADPVKYAADLQKGRKYQKEHRESNREYRRDYKLKARYGISAAEYDEMLMEQGGVCAICEGESGNTRLVVDHDHERGQVRAILCHSCNVGIGMLEDDPARLKKAIRYLKRLKS